MDTRRVYIVPASVLQQRPAVAGLLSRHPLASPALKASGSSRTSTLAVTTRAAGHRAGLTSRVVLFRSSIMATPISKNKSVCMACRARKKRCDVRGFPPPPSPPSPPSPGRVRLGRWPCLTCAATGPAALVFFVSSAQRALQLSALPPAVFYRRPHGRPRPAAALAFPLGCAVPAADVFPRPSGPPHRQGVRVADTWSFSLQFVEHGALGDVPAAPARPALAVPRIRSARSAGFLDVASFGERPASCDIAGIFPSPDLGARAEPAGAFPRRSPGGAAGNSPRLGHSKLGAGGAVSPSRDAVGASGYIL